MLQPNQDLQMQGKVSGADWGVIYPKQKLNYGDFTERLWAYLTIQQLLEKRWVHLSLCRSLNETVTHSKKLLISCLLFSILQRRGHAAGAGGHTKQGSEHVFAIQLCNAAQLHGGHQA